MSVQHKITPYGVKAIESDDVWPVLKIIADFVNGFDEPGDLGPAVTIFGSAPIGEEHL